MKYLRKDRCQNCGQPHWIRYWIGKNCLPSSSLSVTDVDLIVHRHKCVPDNLGARNVEHLMMVEIKSGGERLGSAQQDTLSVVNGLFEEILKSERGKPLNVKTRPHFIVGRDKKVVWHGVHLLRVPHHECRVFSAYWDNHWILTPSQLSSLLSFDLDPVVQDEHNRKRPQPVRLDIDRRKKDRPDQPDMPLLRPTCDPL